MQAQKTQFVGLKEFRQGISTFVRKAAKLNTRYIVLKRNKPVGEFRPLTNKDQIIAQLEVDVAEARAAYKRGDYYTTEEVKHILGLA